MAIIDNITSIYNSLKSRSILQNYTWMTILNIVSPLIGVILYPFVIRKTGSDSYGLFVFAQSVIQYAVQLVSFGFDVPAAKTIAQNKTDKALQSKLVTHVLAMKTMLSLIAVAAFLPFVFTLSILSDNKPIFLWSITLIIAELFNLQFFFQGIGKMKVMSIMSLVFRILMIPAVFLFIDGPEDNVTYMIITGVTLSVGPICNFLWMIWKENVSFTPFSFSYARKLTKDALPFFCTYIFGLLKTSTLTVLIGIFLGMTDVAVYDLGNKIVNIFRNFTQNINTALFPEVVNKASRNNINRVFRYETIISLTVIILIAVVGYPLVLILGGPSMTISRGGNSQLYNLLLSYRWSIPQLHIRAVEQILFRDHRADYSLRIVPDSVPAARHIVQCDCARIHHTVGRTEHGCVIGSGTCILSIC